MSDQKRFELDRDNGKTVLYDRRVDVFYPLMSENDWEMRFQDFLHGETLVVKKTHFRSTSRAGNTLLDVARPDMRKVYCVCETLHEALD